MESGIQANIRQNAHQTGLHNCAARNPRLSIEKKFYIFSATLPVSPEKKPQSAPTIRKRKQLVLIPNEEKDEEFMWPEKKRRPKMSKTPTAMASQKSETPKSTPTTSTSTSKSTPNDNQLQQLLRPPVAMEASFLSPVKQWKQFLASPSRSAQKIQERLAALVSSPTKLLKTPSPAKLLRRPIACINVGHLLTPEKPLFSSLEEQEEEEEDNEHLENESTGNAVEQADQQKENDQPTDEAKMGQPGTSKKGAKKPRKRKEPTANFVSINLRRRRFAPISKLQGAKKWKKFKGQWARGGRKTMFGGR